MPGLPISSLRMSERRFQQEIARNWRYREFFNFLQISPSYRLAHLAHKGALSLKASDLPRDFDRVQQTYVDFGDVTRTYFWQWWLDTAQFQFGAAVTPKPRLLAKLGLREDVTADGLEALTAAATDWLQIDRPAQGSPAVVVVGLPIVSDRREMLKAFNQILDSAYRSSEKPMRLAPYQFLQNKVRHGTVLQARKVVRARAAMLRSGLFEIGARTGISASRAVDIGQKIAADRFDRRLTESLTSRYLQRAHLLAENAARGEFPSMRNAAEVERWPRFDYRELNRMFKEHIRLLEGERSKLLRTKARLKG